MQVDSSGLKVYWTIFQSVLCDHFQVKRNIQENFGKLIPKWYIEYWTYFFLYTFKMHNLKDSEILKRKILRWIWSFSQKITITNIFILCFLICFSIDEVNFYLGLPDLVKNECLYRWWGAYKYTFIDKNHNKWDLAKYSKEVLCTPPSSVLNIFEAKRSRFLPEHGEQIVFLNYMMFVVFLMFFVFLMFV